MGAVSVITVGRNVECLLRPLNLLFLGRYMHNFKSPIALAMGKLETGDRSQIKSLKLGKVSRYFPFIACTKQCQLDFPSSALRMHSCVKFYLDKDSSEKLC